ncbi:MAG: hypothetical protein GTN89_02020 [Acidobacteria bacterium]|nr:hypothetical protein [Acidobacteriota bacterium]NIM61584.1 hypothetical protein [Acidobacteriota bacterium]NIO58148.1 hypothetical protein [Acidobacteriota bacterium]NIQ29164.1 hypothetical protein [Acidobacteriota bacterium]NIQ85076.1 hypothetical protein [Acidobacteriota bacterium]
MEPPGNVAVKAKTLGKQNSIHLEDTSEVRINALPELLIAARVHDHPEPILCRRSFE